MASRPVEQPSLDSFISFLTTEEQHSRDGNLDMDRAIALDMYNGMPLGDEEEGRSQLVTRDVAEVIDYMTVSILDTMVSGDKAVEFEHADKKAAEQASALITRDFRQGRKGYRFLHDWIKAGLLEKSSTAKVCVEPRKPKRVEAQVSALEFTMLQEQGANIIEANQVEDDLFEIAMLEEQAPEFVEYVSPNEESGFAFDATDLDEDCPYLRFSPMRTLSELAEMGFDTDNLSSDSINNNSTLSQARDGTAADWRNMGSQRTGANRKVVHHEEYSLFDLNGDGIAERILSHRVGNKILTRDGQPAVEMIEDHPGVVWCPFPMPNRIVGQSLADKVMDIQVTRSTLMRQAMDNLYQSNAPRMTINESSIGANTIDDLLTVRPNSVVRWKGSVAPTPLVLPFVADSAFQAMEVLTGERESRTGITRLNQGLDPDAMNKTATGMNLQAMQGQQMELYVARNFAEAFARLVLKRYKLMRQFGRPEEVIIDGEVVMVDPRKWPDDMNVIARVGLGSGSKEQRLQHRMVLLQIAQQAIQSGSRIFTDANIYNNVKGLVTDANLGAVRELVTDPEQLGPPEEKPDPNMLKAQADATIAAEKLKLDQTNAQAKSMMAAEQMQVDAALKQQQLDYELQARREKAALDEALARDKANFEANLAQQKADREYELALMRMAQERELAEKQHEQDEKLSSNRPGGALDE